MKNKKTLIWEILFLVLVFGATVYGVFRGEDLERIEEIIERTQKIYLVPAVLCVVFFIWGESIIIYYMMGTLHVRLKKWTCFLFSSIGFFYSCITPSASGGQPAQIYYMKKKDVPIPVSTLVLMVVTITYKAVLVLIGLGMMVFGQGFIRKYLTGVLPVFYLGIALNVICVGVLVLLVFHTTLAETIVSKCLTLLEKIHILRYKESRHEKLRCGMEKYRETAVYADPLSFPPDAEQPDFYTGEEAPHIVFTPYLRALAAQLTEGIASPAEKAKRIYDYVTLNVRYHFQPSYFVHESIAENCARSRRGDCGIMALTFITLCRIAGIPARWESGFAVAPGDAGCHDWARFYVAPKGWMYADCSYGASMARRGDEVLRRHYFGSLDTGRMVANSAFEAPFDPPMLGFRSDPYDNQSGEMEADGVGLYGDDTVTTKEVLKFEEVE